MSYFESQTLCSQRKDGDIQNWKIERQDNRYRTITWKGDNARVTSAWTVVEQGKNLGKKNERNPEQQAQAEVEALIKKKLSLKYHAWHPDSGAVVFYESDAKQRPRNPPKFITPMLAQPYDLDTILVWEHRAEAGEVAEAFPVAVQPKLDGIRCIITRHGAFSRNGKKFVCTKFIEESLTEVFAQHPELIIDGELYNHEFRDDFNRIVSLVRKTKITKKVEEDIKQHLQYHVFGCFKDQLDSTQDIEFRIQFARELLNFENIRIVETRRAANTEELKAQYEEYLTQGYEGMMIYALRMSYIFGRSSALLKCKPSITEEYEILDIEVGKGNRQGMLGRFIFARNGMRFEANALGDYEYYRYIWNNKAAFIGKMATVKYQRLTPKGIPRFPRVIAIRDYE